MPKSVARTCVETAEANALRWCSEEFARFTFRLSCSGVVFTSDENRRLATVRRRIVNREYAKHSREQRKATMNALLHKIENLELLNAVLEKELAYQREQNFNMASALASAGIDTGRESTSLLN